jgi:hypothetical protein
MLFFLTLYDRRFGEPASWVGEVSEEAVRRTLVCCAARFASNRPIVRLHVARYAPRHRGKHQPGGHGAIAEHVGIADVARSTRGGRWIRPVITCSLGQTVCPRGGAGRRPAAQLRRRTSD